MNAKAEENLSELMAQVNSLTVVTEPEPGRIDVRSRLSALWERVHSVFTPKTQAIAGAAKQAKIETQASYDEAVDLLKTIKGTQKDLEKFKAIPDRLNKLWKENLAEYQADANLLAMAETTIKNKILDFDRKKQQEEDARQATLDAENRQRARDEAAERAKQVQVAGGTKTEVAEIKKSHEVMPLPEAKPALQRSSSAAVAENWQAITPRDSKGNLIESEFGRLLAYIVTGKEDAEIKHPEFICVLEINEVTLRRLAKAQKKALKLPAIRVEDKGSLRASAF